MADTPQDNVPSQVSQVQPDIRAPANLTPADFGASIGQAVEEAGSKFQREEVWANQAAVMRATNTLSDFTNQTVYDAKTGVVHQDLGSDAPGAVKSVLDDHVAKISEINDNLNNDAQKQMFAAHAQEHMRGLDRSLNGYEAEQMTRANNQQTEAYVKNTSQSAVRAGLEPPPAAGIPDPVKVRIGQVAQAIQLQGNANHQPQAFIDLQKNNAISAIHAGIVDAQLANNNYSGASAYYDANKGAINEPEASRLQNALKSQDLDNQAQQLQRRYAINDDGTMATRSQFLAKIDDPNNKDLVDNAKLYDKVAERGERHFVMAAQADRADRDQVMQIIGKGIEKSQGAADPQSLVLPSDYQKLDYDERHAMDNLKNQYLKKDRPQGYTPKEYELAQLATSDPEAFKATNLLKFWPDLSDGGTERLGTRQAAMKGDTQAASKSQDIESRQKTADYFLVAQGISPTDNTNITPANNEKRYQFRKQFDEAADLWLQGNPGKRVVPPDQLEAIGKKLVTELYSPSNDHTIAHPFGGTHQVDLGPAYMNPTRSGIDEPVNPVPTKAEIDSWQQMLNRKISDPGRQAAVQKLQRWKQGTTQTGGHDPALQQYYQHLSTALGVDEP